MLWYFCDNKHARIVRPIVKFKSKLYKCSSLFWDIEDCRLVVSHGRFGTIYWSHLQGQTVQSWTNHHSTSRNIQKGKDLFRTAPEA